LTRIEKSIIINTTPEKVWPWVAHEKIPEWFEPFKKVELTSKGGERKGATHHITSELDQIVKAEWEGGTTEWIENKMYSWRSTGGHFTGFGSMILDPLNNQTKFTMIFDYEIPYSLFGKIFDKLHIHKEIEKYIDQGLLKLKAKLEN